MSESPTAMRWFDQLQAVLAEQASLAGLLGHGTMIGNAREFFARKILASFLPPAVHIGTGKIISLGRGVESRQVDLILFDPKFPVLEIDAGVGLYPIEGVIATIEVKSRSNRVELTKALDNCVSVLDIPIAVEPEAYDKRMLSLTSTGLTEAAAEDLIWKETHPYTYIFAFASDLSEDTTTEVFRDWLGVRSPNVHPRNNPLPYVSVLGEILAMQNSPPFETRALMQDLSFINPNLAKPLVAFSRTSRPFGVFACHIISTVTQRLSASERTGRLPRGLAFPMQAYINEGLNFQHVKVINPPPKQGTGKF